MATAAELAVEVRRRVDDMPYQVVDETPDGFAMHIDIVDARWWSLFHRNGLRKTWRWEVTVRGDSYRVADRAADIEWQAGADSQGGVPRPTLRFAAEVQKGTSVSIGRRKTFGVDDEGRYGAVVDYSFDSREGKGVITDAAKGLGLKRTMDVQTKIGLFFAVFAVVGLAIGGIVVLILFLTGNMPEGAGVR